MPEDKVPTPPANSDNSQTLNEMIKIGLTDPFIRTIVGVVAIATAAGFAISILGDGTKAVIAVGLSLMFGVVLVVLRVLMNNSDGAFVRGLCFLASGVIVLVFLALVILAVPAVTICWPLFYSETLGLRSCSGSGANTGAAFTVVPYTGSEIKFDAANRSTQVLIFFRSPRQKDAERLVGVLQAAGFTAPEGVETDLNEVVADSRSPGLSLIKTTAAARPFVSLVLRAAQIAIPDKLPGISIYPTDSNFTRGAIQILLF